MRPEQLSMRNMNMKWMDMQTHNLNTDISILNTNNIQPLK